MSSFTDNIVVMAVPLSRSGWHRWLPPGFHQPRWELWNGFTYAVGDLGAPQYTVSVPKKFQFDGASVPLLFRMLVPMAHPNYIQAAALHDYMLGYVELYGRRTCDLVFYEALGVLGMPLFWRFCLYSAVRIGGWKRWKDRLKGAFRAN